MLAAKEENYEHAPYGSVRGIFEGYFSILLDKIYLMGR